MAMDRGEILEALRDGHGQLGVGPVLPFHWAWNDELEPLPYHPDSALALLRGAGIRDTDGDGVLERSDGQDFTLDLKFPAGNDYLRDLAEAIRNDLAELGIRVTTSPVELTTLIGDVTSPDRRFEGALLGWTGDFRLDLRDLFHTEALEGPYQFASFSDPEVDSLLDRAGAEVDTAVAAPAWRRIQEILREQQPWTVLYYDTDVLLARDRVHDMDMDIRGTLVNVSDWWVGADQPTASEPPSDPGG
jgi:peptide/nickel transport system substrate-binding protein